VGLLLTFVVFFLGLSVFLWAGTLFFQAYIYSEPAAQLFWRAPAAAAAFTLFLALWCRLDYSNPGRYNTIFDWNDPRDDVWVEKFIGVKNKKEIVFSRKKEKANKVVYRDELGNAWRKADTEGVMEAIIIEDKDGEKIRFEVELIDGKFKPVPRGETIVYKEVGGKKREMHEDDVGRLTTMLWGVAVLNLFFNILHGAVWFAVLWLILRFQWSHALGFAFVFWLVASFFLPPLFAKVEAAAKAAPRAAATTHNSQLLVQPFAYGWLSETPKCA
jgi:hypothetical protein